MQQKTPSAAMRVLILATTAILFLLFYSVSTSPLTVYYGDDSAFFILVGQGMRNGLLPYRDFFDMKGPYLFLLEYIGQLIHNGRTGAFVLQCLNLTFCLWVTDKIYQQQNPAPTLKKWLKDFLILILPCLYVLSYTLQAGNLTEELSLPFLLPALYFVLAYLKKLETDPNADHPLKHGFYYGFAFGVLALIRITNAALIGAILLTTCLDLLFRRKFKNLFFNGLAFLLGFFIAVAPMCLYYAQQNLLKQMLSQVFLFGVRYSTEHNLLDKTLYFLSFEKLTLITMTFPMVVAALFRYQNWKYWTLSVSSYLLLILACAMGNGYPHYLTLGIPHLVLGFALLKELCSRKRIARHTTAILILLFLVMGSHIVTYTFLCGQEIFAPDQSKEYRQHILEVKDAIKTEAPNSVYVYSVRSCSNWYLQSELFPPCKYCDWQEHYITLNPQIGVDITLWMLDEPPQYVVVSTRMPITYDEFSDILYTDYFVSMENESFILYAHKSVDA